MAGLLKQVVRPLAGLRWRWALVALTLVLSASAGVYAYLGRTVTRAVNYEDCTVEHGKLIGSWRGQGNEPWNETGYYYEARRFGVLAESKQGFIFRNVAEDQPTFISSAGEDSCSGGFDGAVAVANAKWRWEGARAVDIRVGVPNLGDVNNHGVHEPAPSLSTDSTFSPPVYGEDGDRAAAMVDDNGRAVLTAGEEEYELWCFHAGFGGDDCQLNRDVAKPARSAGYLFAIDNCPDVFSRAGVMCDRAAGWYRQVSFGDLVGRNGRGELKPFKLDVEAVSTFAPRVGAWMVAVFKYPAIAQINSEIAANSVKLDPGDTLRLTLKLTKTGPDLSSLGLNTNLDKQPLARSIDQRLSEQQLAQLNQEGDLSVVINHPVSGNATRSKCHEYQLRLAAESAHRLQVAQPRFSYCIKAARQIEYTYSVESLGEVEADELTFGQAVAETFNHRLGWGSVGITFTEVAASADFVVYLTSPTEVNRVSSGCDATYSCQVGSGIYINDERWRNATPSWNASGGSLRDYRHMVVNHEVGHWLGFGHLNCPNRGQLAPVMQQQSIDLAGCRHNPWPTESELTTLKNRLNL